MKKIVIITICTISLFNSCVTGSRPASIANLVSLDEALTGAVWDISSRVTGMTEIAIAQIDSPLSVVSDFISEELESHLVSGGSFTVLERGSALMALNAEHQFQMSGMVTDNSAVGIGRYLGAKVILTGSFLRFEDFSQLRLRAISVETAQLLTLYTARIQPNDTLLASVMRPLDNIRLPSITENALAYMNLGEELFRDGKFDEAIRELDRALAINMDLTEAFFFRGSAYLFKGDYERAIADFNAVLKIQPDYANALGNRGAVYLLMGDYDRAIADFNATLRIQPDDASDLNSRGVAYLLMGDHDRAIADFNTALRIQPDYASAQGNRGSVYVFMGDYNRAIVDLNVALRILPENYYYLMSRSVAYISIGDYDRAIADLTAMLRIRPDEADSFNNRGFAYNNRGQSSDFNRAIEDFNQAIRLNPNFANPYRHRAFSNMQIGNYAQARADINRALQINQNYGEAQTLSEELRRMGY